MVARLQGHCHRSCWAGTSGINGQAKHLQQQKALGKSHQEHWLYHPVYPTPVCFLSVVEGSPLEELQGREIHATGEGQWWTACRWVQVHASPSPVNPWLGDVKDHSPKENLEELTGMHRGCLCLTFLPPKCSLSLFFFITR